MDEATTPDWTEDNAGLTYANRALGIRAHIWGLFHGGYAWYVMQGKATVARGSTPKGTAEARAAANAAITFLEHPTPTPERTPS
jgi:hypothetical protein